MTLSELDEYFRSFLNIENFSGDPSKNGIQVQNSKPESAEITKVAFAVDACLETIEGAIESGSQVLFVHHGLFWGHEQPIVSNHYKRIKSLIDNNIALYACHIPLDANEIVGNNYGLATKLGLESLQPFGLWNSMTIGVQGVFLRPQTIEDVSKKILPKGETALVTLPFGKKDIHSVAIVSGGAEDLLSEAIDKNLDLYITGEISHESYHYAKESCINVIGGGHYNTEIIGVSLVAQKLKEEKNVETIFLNVPTKL